MTPYQFLSETSIHKEEDQLLITAKARFTIDLLTVAYEALISRQPEKVPAPILKQSSSEEPHDTPAFDRK